MKKPHNNIDYLIVGQGLAGSLLGWILMQQGQSIRIIDQGSLNASRVAAGLINPVTGMRLTKSLKIKQQLFSAKRLYRSLEEHFKRSFFVEKPMFRLLRSAEERQQAKKRLSDPDYANFLPGLLASHPDINSPLGLLQQNQTGYLKTCELLDCLRDYFIDNQCLIESRLDPAEIKLSAKLLWRNYAIKKIIFCQGYEGIGNPWFRYLPLKPVKGEILTLQSTQPLIQQIINYGHWFLPLDTTLFKTGATFDREHINLRPTTEAKQILFTDLSQIYPKLAKTVTLEHQVGIRPTTDDRHPLIGPHPKLPDLYIFNGFGSKGSLLIPYYAQLLCQHLLQQHPLPYECNINRYA